MCKTQIQEFSKDFILSRTKKPAPFEQPLLSRNDLTIIFITFMFFAAKAFFMERNNTAI